MRTLEEAMKDKTMAQMGIEGSQLWNIYGKTVEERTDMNVAIAKLWIDYNKASAEVEEIIKHQSEKGA